MSETVSRSECRSIVVKKKHAVKSHASHTTLQRAVHNLDDGETLGERVGKERAVDAEDRERWGSGGSVAGPAGVGGAVAPGRASIRCRTRS